MEHTIRLAQYSEVPEMKTGNIVIIYPYRDFLTIIMFFFIKYLVINENRLIISNVKILISYTFNTKINL